MQEETLEDSDSEMWIWDICGGLQYGQRVLAPLYNVDGIEDLRQYIRECETEITKTYHRYDQLAGHELLNNDIHASLKIELKKLNTGILPILSPISESSPQTQGSEKYVVDKEQYQSITSAIGEITASCTSLRWQGFDMSSNALEMTIVEKAQRSTVFLKQGRRQENQE